MPKKNANGEGTIYKRKDGRWCSAVTIGYNPNGSLKRKYLYGKTRNEVYQKMVEFQRNMHINDGYIKDENITLTQWVKICLFEYMKPTVRPATFQRKESIYRVHIQPSRIGNMKLKDIKPFHIQTFLNSKTDMVNSSIRKIHQLLSQCFKQAIVNDMIWKNPSEHVVIPKSKKESKEHQYFSRKEQKKYMAALEMEKQKALFLTALFTGMREGELIALKWPNIDFENHKVKVDESYEKVRIFDEKGNSKYQTIKQPPKTKASNREISIPEFLVNELKKHRIKQKEHAIKNGGSSFNKSKLVFCSEVGTPLLARNIMRTHERICKNAQIDKITFHALRHTFASRMYEEGANIKEVQELLGHATKDVALDIYIHVNKNEERKNILANKQNELFKSLTE